MLISICAICLGASLGAVLRWRLAVGLNARFPKLPPGTLAANLLGGYTIGIAMGVFAAFPLLSPDWKLLTVTGFLGGLTTFSTFSAEVVTALLEGRGRWALSSIGAHVGGSIGMTLLGVGTVRLVLFMLALGAARAPEAALTLPQLMAGRVDPAADALWDSVAFIASTSGVEDRRPQTPAQWQALRVSALQLVEAAKLLESPGLTMGSAEAAPGSGELSRAEIQRRMTASHEEFTRRARTLGRTARQALASIDARDAEALMAAGGAIDDACEACHVIYWYPDQAASRR